MSAPALRPRRPAAGARARARLDSASSIAPRPVPARASRARVGCRLGASAELVESGKPPLGGAARLRTVGRRHARAGLLESDPRPRQRDVTRAAPTARRSARRSAATRESWVASRAPSSAARASSGRQRVFDQPPRKHFSASPARTPRRQAARPSRQAPRTPRRGTRLGRHGQLAQPRAASTCALNQVDGDRTGASGSSSASTPALGGWRIAVRRAHAGFEPFRPTSPRPAAWQDGRSLSANSRRWAGPTRRAREPARGHVLGQLRALDSSPRRARRRRRASARGRRSPRRPRRRPPQRGDAACSRIGASGSGFGSMAVLSGAPFVAGRPGEIVRGRRPPIVGGPLGNRVPRERDVFGETPAESFRGADQQARNARPRDRDAWCRARTRPESQRAAALPRGVRAKASGRAGTPPCDRTQRRARPRTGCGARISTHSRASPGHEESDRVVQHLAARPRLLEQMAWGETREPSVPPGAPR